MPWFFRLKKFKEFVVDDSTPTPASANLVGGVNLLGRQIYLAQGTDNLLAVMVVRIYSAHPGAKYAAP
jgi:hypothetical protein